MESEKLRFLEEFTAKLGVMTQTCESTGIPRKQVNQWIEDDPDFAEEIDSIEERRLDFAENSLFRQIQEGNTAATIAYLKMKGKGRGYSEKMPSSKGNSKKRIIQND